MYSCRVLIFSGSGDQVRCFFCNIGLKNWDASDNPWNEHQKWSDKCGYLRQLQGQTEVKPSFKYVSRFKWLPSILWLTICPMVHFQTENWPLSVATQTTLWLTENFEGRGIILLLLFHWAF